MKPSGYLCIADLDEEDGSFHGEGFIGHNGFDRAKLAAMIEKSGFADVQSNICYEVKKKNPDGTIRIYPVFFMIAKKQNRDSFNFKPVQYSLSRGQKT